MNEAKKLSQHKDAEMLSRCETPTRSQTLRTAALAGFAGALAFGIAGCKGNTQAPVVSTNGQDPADANVAQPYTGGTTGD